MNPLLIKGGHIIDPAQKIDRVGNLLITAAKISWLGDIEQTPPASGYDVLTATGLVVSPGFIDMHCHLRQPGYEEKETIATGTKAAARGGFTTVCCMPNTNPPLDNAGMIDYVKSTALSEGIVRVLPVGCISKGRKGKELAKLEEMASAGAIGFSDDGSPVMNSKLTKQALEIAKSLGLPVIDHCEDTALTECGVMNEGAVSAKSRLKGMPAVAEEIMVARDVLLAELTGARIHIAHVSTEGSVELIRQAKKKGIHVTAEVTPHHLTLTEEAVINHGSNAKVNPPLRTERDVEALIRGLNEGVIDIIATDHAPHTLADKQGNFNKAAFGISGLETALGSLMSLVHSGKILLAVLISKLASEPAKIIDDKFGNLGTLAISAPADLTIFDPDKGWTVDPANFASKGKNTLLAGSTLKGKVMATIAQGEIAYKDSSLKIEKRELNRVTHD